MRNSMAHAFLSWVSGLLTAHNFKSPQRTTMKPETRIDLPKFYELAEARIMGDLHSLGAIVSGLPIGKLLQRIDRL